ncbi:MAG: sigma-70 family RNA polymerase sigma factor, partial [Acidimicrobiales bacterium]
MALDDEGRRDLRQKFVELAATKFPGLRAELVEAHLGLAEHLARRFDNRGEPLDLLVQVASLSLLKAVDRFEPQRGLDFSTYATHTIVEGLKRHLRDEGWAVRVPRRTQELHLRLSAVVATLNHELGRSPTIAEIAAAASASEEEVLEALEAGQADRSASLDTPAPGQGTNPPATLLGG